MRSQDITDKLNMLSAADKAALGRLTSRKSDVLTPDGLGIFRQFLHGAIYSKNAFAGLLTPNACAVFGPVYQKWMAFGGESISSPFGFPVTDCVTLPQGRGVGCIFERGAIASSPAAGVHETHGQIFQRWVRRSDFNGLGIPLTDETITADNRGGRFNHFENGSIFWLPQWGANDVVGNMKAVWFATAPGQEPEQGPLGYPAMSPQSNMPGSTTNFQDFEKGTIYEGGAGNQFIVIRTPSVVAHSFDEISWGSFGAVLPDGDIIHVSFAPNFPQFNVNVTLTAAPAINWWKAVDLWSPSQGNIQEVYTQDARKSATMSISPSSLAVGGRFLLFQKAKFLGIHQGMYLLPLPDRMIGCNVTFTWVKD